MNAHHLEILQHEAVDRNAAESRYRRLRLRSSRVAQEAQPGQYMHVLPHSNSYDPLLRRAFSILRCGSDWFEMLYRIEGRGTQLLSERRVGDNLDVLGPLGRPFSPVGKKLLLVGGGVGVPPLVFLAERTRDTKEHVSRETEELGASVEAFIGARSAEDVVEESALRASTDALFIATQDGSVGERGLVTLPLERRLQELSKSAGHSDDVTVCACGPWPMLRAVAQLCAAYQVPCQVSLEENMPCGIGVCNGCVVPVLGDSDEYGRYRRICVDGPVMNGAQIDWGTTAVTAGLEDGRAAREGA